jgi:hypothetical protein
MTMSEALAQNKFSCPACGAEAQWLCNPFGIQLLFHPIPFANLPLIESLTCPAHA